MKLVQINVNDAFGERFNGLSITGHLKALGVDSTHLVWNRTMIEPHIKTLLPYPGVRAFNRLAGDLEARWSLQSRLQAQSFALAAQPEFVQADVAHYHIIQDGFFSLDALPMLSRIKPSVWTWHDPWPMTGHCLHPKECQRWRIGCGYCPDLERIYPMREDKTAQAFAHKRAIVARSKLDIVVASRWMLDMARASPIAEGARLHHVPFGLDTDIYRPMDKAALRERLGIEPGRIVIALRAQTSPFKGLSDLVTALSDMETSTPLCILTVQETGHFDHLLGRHQVIDMGWISGHQEMAEVLAACDLYVMPSTADAFGLMAVEAMACGAPVLAYEGTALPGVIGVPDVGVATPMGDIPGLKAAIKHLVEDPEQIRKRGLLARAMVERDYTIGLHVERLHKIYREAANRRAVDVAS
jgi:glycosyltransferase involved in cell wall biosynthesis